MRRATLLLQTDTQRDTLLPGKKAHSFRRQSSEKIRRHLHTSLHSKLARWKRKTLTVPATTRHVVVAGSSSRGQRFQRAPSWRAQKEAMGEGGGTIEGGVDISRDSTVGLNLNYIAITIKRSNSVDHPLSRSKSHLPPLRSYTTNPLITVVNFRKTNYKVSSTSENPAKILKTTPDLAICRNHACIPMLVDPTLSRSISNSGVRR